MVPRDLLGRYPLFAALGSRVLDVWLASAETLTVGMGETLFQAGTPGRHAYLVETGRVRVLRPTRSGREVSLGIFGPGDLFGEYALLPPGHNTATCRAGTPSRLWRLPLGELRRAIAARPALDEQLKRWLRLHALLGYLRERAFLGFISANTLSALLDRFEELTVPAGRTIQSAGLGADRWFVIRAGQVGLYPEQHPGEAPSRLLERGDCFGEQGLLDGHGLPQAESLTDTTCLMLRREAFLMPLEAGTVNFQTLGSKILSPHPVYPWVGQQEAADCGVAALAMVARFHGLAVSAPQLRQKIQVQDEGTSLLELQRTAGALGFHAPAVRIGAKQLYEVALPAIAHLGGGHYVVLYAVGVDEVTLGDPTTGVVTMPGSVFRQRWTHQLLLLLPPTRSTVPPSNLS